MKIHLLSDLHLEFGGFTPPATDADLVILAGDIHVKQHALAWAREHFKVPVVYVPGNHEHYGSSLGRTPRKLKEKALGSHVHVLDNDIFVLGDVRVLGTTLWTDYRLTGNQPLAEVDALLRMSDFKAIRNRTFGRLRPFHVLAEHAQARIFLQTALATPFAGKTVVVTHHAPLPQAITAQHQDKAGSHLSASYASDLERLMGAEQVALWAFGHTHSTVDLDCYGTRVISNPRGYSPNHLNPDFNPALVIEI